MASERSPAVEINMRVGARHVRVPLADCSRQSAVDHRVRNGDRQLGIVPEAFGAAADETSVSRIPYELKRGHSGVGRAHQLAERGE